MKSSFQVVFVLMLNVYGLCVSAETTGAFPEIRGRKITTAPHVDGRLTEKCWKEGEVGEFWKMDGSGKAEVSPRVWVVYNDTTLYIAFECPLNDAAAMKKAKEAKPDQIWSGDTVEVFLSPCPETRTYYQLAVNSANARYSEKDLSPWSNPWESSVQIGEDSWSVEIAIPFASLSARELMGKDWRINLAWGTCVWAPTFLTYHQPDKFGWLRGLEVDFSDYRWVVVPKGLKVVGGEASMVVFLHDLSDKKHQIDVSIKGASTGSEKKTPFIVRQENLNIQRWEVGVDFKVPVTRPDPFPVEVAVMDSVNHRVWAYATETISGPQIARGVWDRSFYMNEKEAKLQISCSVAEMAGAKLQCSLRPVGEAKNVQNGVITLDKERCGTVTFDLQNLPVGSYQVVLSSVTGDYVKGYAIDSVLRKLPFKNGAVQYTDRGVLLRNGKPIFPLGVSFVSRHFQKDPTLLKDYLDTNYNHVNLEWMGADEAVRSMKEIDAYDLYSVVGISCCGEVLPVREKTPGDIKAITSAAKSFVTNVLKASDEKILAWYTWDEAPLGLPFETLRSIHQMVKEVDPYHPTFTASNVPGIYSAFYEATDVLGPDPYPNFPGGNVRMVCGWVDAARRAMKNKPVIVYLQTFFDKGTMPSPVELRCMTYLSLVHDVNGVIYYSYDHTAGPMAQKFPETWDAVKQLGHEIGELNPAILSEALPADAVRVINGSGIETRLYLVGTDYYLIAVNGDREPRNDVKFAIRTEGLSQTKPKADVVQVLFENRTVVSRNGSWTDRFEPLAVHVYRMGQKK